MKNNIFNTFFAILLLLLLVNCDDRENVIVDSQSAPIIATLSTQKVVLDKNFPDNPALTVYWDVAKYSVPTEIRYKVEASNNSSFNSPVIVIGNTVAESTRGITFTAKQLNDAAALLNLVPNSASNMYLRVVSSLGTSSYLSSTSNITSISITPYVLVYPDFYLVGAASYVGWSAANAQLLYKSKNMSYIYTYLENNQTFRFLGQKDWNPINYSIDQSGTRDNYKYFKQVSSSLVQDGDENMKFTGTTGIYKMSIDATSGVQSLAISPSPVSNYDPANLYIVGSINAWDPANAIAMTKITNSVFEIIVKLDNASEFKFIGQKSWGDLEWGNLLKDNNGYSEFLGPKGDNSNVKFDGGGSNYKISVNLKAGTYSIVKQ